MLRMSRERLKELLMEAYESGWSGALELKEEHAELVLDGLADLLEPSVTSTLTISSNPISTAGVNDLMSQHYSYCGYNMLGGTVLVNDPEEEI